MMRRTGTIPGLAVAGLILACGGSPPPERPGGGSSPSPDPTSAPTAETMVVRVHLTRNGRPEPIERVVPRRDAVLSSALSALLAGPTPEERRAGFSSFFSPATAGMLERVEIDPTGRAIVDFEDFSRIIPNASSSAGSDLLLGELNATVFQFPSVRSVLYRFEGSCDAFWNWLQRGCTDVPR